MVVVCAKSTYEAKEKALCDLNKHIEENKIERVDILEFHTEEHHSFDPINNWSSKITKYAHDIVEQAQREKETAEREKYDKEEAIIQMYR